MLFDLDGTLADTIALILRCYRHTMKRHLGAVLPDELWLSTIGTPLRDQLAAFARSAEEAAAMMETYQAFQKTVHDEMVAPYDGALTLLQDLRSRSVPVAVVTSKRREIAFATLRRCGLDGWVDLVVSADDVRNGKPDPEPVRAAVDALGVPASRAVLFVGDSPFDINAGNAAGVSTGAALWGPFSRAVLEAAGPHHYLASLSDVGKLAPRGR